jgi:hypothetical protein
MYSVKIKKLGSLFSKTFKNVKGDGIIQNPGQAPVQARFLILEDGRRIEIPFSLIIEFSEEREAEIKRDITDTAQGKKKK